MSTSLTINNIYIDNILASLAQNNGIQLLNIMNSNEEAHGFIEKYMYYFIKEFINQRPYEQFLWDTYKPNTIEEFKKNLYIQEMINSNDFEEIIANHNSKNIINYSSGEQYILGKNGITKERKLLISMLYYSNYLIDITNNRLELLMYEFDNFINEQIKFFIKLLILNPNIGDIQDIEDDTKFICNINEQEAFINYMNEMSSLNASVYDIIQTFICYKEYKLELFKKYCQYGFWSEHAKKFIDDNINITEQSKQIYFALVNQVGYNVLCDCIKQNVIRDLTVEPLTIEEQKYLKHELNEYNYARKVY